MIPATSQIGLFSEEEIKRVKSKESVLSDFVSPNPETLYVGSKSLRQYLEENKLGSIIKLREILEKTDLMPFKKKYNPAGRHPIEPLIPLGLILFGMTESRWTLRALEMLSKMDMRAWWICGGVTLDHSTIGKFILKHDKELSGSYFEELTKTILKELKIGRTDVSGDGTTIEAMASRYKLLRAEALKEEIERAREEAKQRPDDNKTQEKIEQLKEAEKILGERQAKKKQEGKASDKITIHPGEPEASVQPLKNKTKRPSYKPSVLANEPKIIVGQHVEASNETAAVKPMLEQHKRIVGEEVGRLLLDAGYSNSTIFEAALKRSIDLLCPSGKVVDGDWDKKGVKGKYHKSAFEYREDEDIYICPAGERLKFIREEKDSKGRSYRKYGCSACEGCPLRSKCTESKRGRRIKRYEVDEYKEVMQKVLSQPAAQEKYRQRQATVEPVFSELKLIQGLTRFRRRGLKKVRVEFSLHCMAYNLRKAVGIIIFLCQSECDKIGRNELK